MPWSPELITKLGEPTFSPLFRLVGENVIDGVGRLAEAFTIPHNRIVIEQSSADGAGRLQTAGGIISVSRGSFSVAIAATPEEFVGTLGSVARRGSVIRLEIGWPGLDTEDYEVIQRGVLRNIRQRGAVFVLECDSMIGYLQSRTIPVGGNGGTEALFYNVTVSTVLIGAYVVGDATVNVLTAGWTANGAGLYCFRITPDSGDDFYLTATGKTFNTFTGCSAVGQFGTTAGNAALGNAVASAFHDEANPTIVARRILTSRGAVGNGTYDYYPSSWAFGLPAEILDDVDIEWWRDVTFPASGSGVYYLVVDEPQPEALTWLEAWLNPAGYFLCERMGLITIRALHPVGGDAAVGTSWESPGTTQIGLHDIVSVDDHERWDSTASAEYEGLTITDGLGVESTQFSGVPPISRPSAYESIGPSVPGIRGNETALKTEVLSRLAPFAHRISEVLSITCRGWSLATLAIGDIVTVTAPVVGRAATEAQPTMTGQRALVASVQPNWFGLDDGAVTRLVLLVQPEYDDDNV